MITGMDPQFENDVVMAAIRNKQRSDEECGDANIHIHLVSDTQRTVWQTKSWCGGILVVTNIYIWIINNTNPWINYKHEDKATYVWCICMKTPLSYEENDNAFFW